MSSFLLPMDHRADEVEVRDELSAIAGASMVGDRDSARLALAIFALVDELRAQREDVSPAGGQGHR